VKFKKDGECRCLCQGNALGFSGRQRFQNGRSRREESFKRNTGNKLGRSRGGKAGHNLSTEGGGQQAAVESVLDAWKEGGGNQLEK